jgi:hypothetical protein
MTPDSKSGLKYAGVLFVASLLGLSAACFLAILLGVPLVRWLVHGVLYFSIDVAFLWRVVWYVLGMSVVITAVMWLEGKWKGRW